MADAQLDDFLGVKPAPAWRRYVKWALVAIGVVLLALLRLHIGSPGRADSLKTLSFCDIPAKMASPGSPNWGNSTPDPFRKW